MTRTESHCKKNALSATCLSGGAQGGPKAASRARLQLWCPLRALQGREWGAERRPACWPTSRPVPVDARDNPGQGVPRDLAQDQAKGRKGRRGPEPPAAGAPGRPTAGVRRRQ